MADSGAPLVTIAIPTFNRAERLPAAVSAACAQTYPSVEVLIVDNCSEDGTPDVCAELAGDHPRIRYVRQPRNIGPIRNFEAALLLARGAYFMWLADDDWITPEYVSRCVCALERGGHALVVGVDRWQSDAGGTPVPAAEALEGDPKARLLRYLREVTANSAVYGLARTSTLRGQLPFPSTVGGDILWVMRILAGGTIAVVPDAELRRSRGGVSYDFKRMAAVLGRGRFARHLPQTTIALEMAKGCMVDTRIRGVLRNPFERAWFALRAGVIMWARFKAMGDYTHALRVTLQGRIPPAWYGRARSVYRPVRRLQDGVRARVLSGPSPPQGA